MSDTTLQASVVKETLKFRHQRTVNDIYSPEFARDLSARDQSHALAVRDRTRALLSEQFVFPFVSCLVCSGKRLRLYAMQRLSWLW